MSSEFEACRIFFTAGEGSPILTQDNSSPTFDRKVARMAYFSEISKIKFEGPDSKNQLSYRHYNESEMVDGKSIS
jgi:hypothetical protein